MLLSLCGSVWILFGSHEPPHVVFLTPCALAPSLRLWMARRSPFSAQETSSSELLPCPPLLWLQPFCTHRRPSQPFRPVKEETTLPLGPHHRRRPLHQRRWRWHACFSGSRKTHPDSTPAAREARLPLCPHNMRCCPSRRTVPPFRECPVCPYSVHPGRPLQAAALHVLPVASSL